MKDTLKSTAAQQAPHPEGMKKWAGTLAGQLHELGNTAQHVDYWIRKASGSAERAGDVIAQDGGEAQQAWKQADRDSMQVVGHIRLWEAQRRILNRALRDLQQQLDEASDRYRQHELNLRVYHDGVRCDDDGNLMELDGTPVNIPSAGSFPEPKAAHSSASILQVVPRVSAEGTAEPVPCLA